MRNKREAQQKQGKGGGYTSGNGGTDGSGNKYGSGAGSPDQNSCTVAGEGSSSQQPLPESIQTLNQGFPIHIKVGHLYEGYVALAGFWIFIMSTCM